MRITVFFALWALVSSAALAGTYAVKKGKPHELNSKTSGSSSSDSKNVVVIKDPILSTSSSTYTPKKRKRPKKQRVFSGSKQSLHSFKSISIDGRRSKPRVKFTLPVIDVERVGETFSFEAEKKIRETK